MNEFVLSMNLFIDEWINYLKWKKHCLKLESEILDSLFMSHFSISEHTSHFCTWPCHPWLSWWFSSTPGSNMSLWPRAITFTQVGPTGSASPSLCSRFCQCSSWPSDKSFTNWHMNMETWRSERSVIKYFNLDLIFLTCIYFLYKYVQIYSFIIILSLIMINFIPEVILK